MTAIGSKEPSVKYLQTISGHESVSMRSDGPVDPVGNVKTAVKTERGEVMGRDSLCFTCTLEHKQLREDCDAF